MYVILLNSMLLIVLKTYLFDGMFHEILEISTHGQWWKQMRKGTEEATGSVL